jgi:hypothetical protein
MNAEDRLTRALGARVAPAKDMRFTLQVLQRAEAERFQRDAARRMVSGAALAAMAALAVVGVSSWAAQNADVAWDAVLAAGGLLAFVSLSRLVGRRLATSPRLS